MNSIVCAASSWASFRSAIEAKALKRLGYLPSYNACVSLHLNDWIMATEYYVLRNMATRVRINLKRHRHKNAIRIRHIRAERPARLKAKTFIKPLRRLKRSHRPGL